VAEGHTSGFLETDRWSFLAVQAHKRGLLSFKEEDRQDDRWRALELLIFDEIERDYAIDLHRDLHHRESACAQYSAGEKVFDHHYNRARVHYKYAHNLSVPYDKMTETVVDNHSMESLIERWKARFGDPSDPEVKKRIEKTVEAWRNG